MKSEEEEEVGLSHEQALHGMRGGTSADQPTDRPTDTEDEFYGQENGYGLLSLLVCNEKVLSSASALPLGSACLHRSVAYICGH